MADEVDPNEKPALPTYQTIANALEKKNGSGVRLLGYTVLRTAMIAPPFLAVGVPVKKAFAGAILASSLISIFTLLRIYNADFEQNWAAARRAERAHQRRLARARSVR